MMKDSTKQNKLLPLEPTISDELLFLTEAPELIVKNGEL
jgi:hypothetical protein